MCICVCVARLVHIAASLSLSCVCMRAFDPYLTDHESQGNSRCALDSCCDDGFPATGIFALQVFVVAVLLSLAVVVAFVPVIAAAACVCVCVYVSQGAHEDFANQLIG